MTKRSLILSLLLTWGCSAASGESDRPTGANNRSPTPASVASGPVPAPGMAWIIFGSDTAFAEVARTGAEREVGLMNRERLELNHGMIFVYDQPEVLSFWMKNTLLPLDVAFMDPGFRVTEIQSMEPESEDLHTAREPALAALEMDKGWFAERGIGPGAVAKIVWGR